MKYTIEINENGVKLTADYGHGSTCETRPKNFAQAIELIETWYQEDKNLTQWGKN
jgi:hypothetical protein